MFDKLRVSIQKLFDVSRQAHEEEKPDGRVWQLKPLEMGVQVPRCFIPKYQLKKLYKELRQHLGEVFKRLAEQKESSVVEGHLQPAMFTFCYRFRPKCAVSQVIGLMKGKSAIHLAREYGERRQNFAGPSCWARGFLVSTVGRDDAVVREYIRNQEKEDQCLEQLKMWQ